MSPRAEPELWPCSWPDHSEVQALRLHSDAPWPACWLPGGASVAVLDPRRAGHHFGLQRSLLFSRLWVGGGLPSLSTLPSWPHRTARWPGSSAAPGQEAQRRPGRPLPRKTPGCLQPPSLCPLPVPRGRAAASPFLTPAAPRPQGSRWAAHPSQNQCLATAQVRGGRAREAFLGESQDATLNKRAALGKDKYQVNLVSNGRQVMLAKISCRSP